MRAVAASSYQEWRDASRRLLKDNVAPSEVFWTNDIDGQSSLAFDLAGTDSEKISNIKVPQRFLTLAKIVSSHNDATRWALLYDVLYRLTHGEPNLLEIDIDTSVRRIKLMETAVRHDIHRTYAFVRFRRVESKEGERFIAWHRPDHYVLELAAPFFVERFGSMHWAILTPYQSAFWDQRELKIGPGVPQSAAPSDDELEELWRQYYASIFNPARVNPKALKTEMPTRYWSTLPEARTISTLLINAKNRTDDMIATAPVSASPFVPATKDLQVLRSAISKCQGCDLYKCATQPVFGRGPSDSRLVFVGEQPGDQEDIAGEPFVGPAGRLFDQALSDAGIDRGATYVTNAVKHFKFEERGKRRIHKTPRGNEISACRPWLEAELACLKPSLIVCLGATAAQSLLGRVVPVNKMRGTYQRHHMADLITVTLHPSALLRIQEPALREKEYVRFVGDLRGIRQALSQ